MAERGQNVLHIPRSDDEGAPVLLQIVPAPSASASRPLDARLVGTEGEAPYVLSLKHDGVDKLRDKSSPCSQDEWEHVLASVLLDPRPTPDVDVSATIQEGASLTITFQRRLEGRQQRLGSLVLAIHEEEEAQLFDWCVAALERQSQAEKDLVVAEAKNAELEATLAGLRGQLDEFIAAKEADETELLDKFVLLLNEKKRKIRDQQEIINSAKKDAGAPLPLQEDDPDESELETKKKPSARSSRAAKRKVDEAAVSDAEGSGDGFEAMDVDDKREAQQEEEDRQTTDEDATASEPDDDDDDDEDEDNGQPPARATRSHDGAKTTSKGKAPAATGISTGGPSSKASLPLVLDRPQTAAGPSTRSAPPAASGGSETESDDEL